MPGLECEPKHKELPETICNLRDLQTLNIRYCSFLSRLPEGIERLVNLKHLDNALCSILYQIPQGIEKLTGLGTLSQFNYAERDWSKLGYLKELDQLSGSLELRIRLHDRQDVDEARKARLINKIHIEDMSFFFVRDAMGRSEEGELVRNEALEALQPPPKLKYLMICGFRGTRFPSWISPSCLSHLRRLNIEECNYISTLPCLEKLPELVELVVGGMRELKFVGREFGNRRGYQIVEWDLLPYVDPFEFQRLSAMGRMGGHNGRRRGRRRGQEHHHEDNAVSHGVDDHRMRVNCATTLASSQAIIMVLYSGY
ncbi:UNVERIFIED_CONTAM: hypothetical protein Sangu_2093000 [Sesamum angustifolium]|uniref:R13L1/DRL21-like LRR repeat region domain-containing protein n=1 Tax=Sesamum angustifolium TaxID=2727405 RepID=A0AAW2LK99_9LAMI